jgi:hypothetical protein
VISIYLWQLQKHHKSKQRPLIANEESYREKEIHNSNMVFQNHQLIMTEPAGINGELTNSFELENKDLDH